MALQFSDEFKQIWEKELKDGQINWMILTEEPKGQVQFVNKGNGGYDEFVENLCVDDKVYFGALRITAVDDDSRRTKLLYVVWIGPKVAPLKRARVSTVKSAFELFYKGLHLEIAASAKDDLDKVQLEKRLQAATGAHKPKRYVQLLQHVYSLYLLLTWFFLSFS